MLRDYQADAVRGMSNILYSENKRTALMQLPTGAGKTAVVSEIIQSVFSKNRRAWFVVPRNELLSQASAHLSKWKVPHGVISAGSYESRAYLVHVVSKDSLLRRLGKIKNFPDILIFDEAHVALDAQMKIIACMPSTAKIIGVTATPERADGRGLSDVYEGVYYGPSIPFLTEGGYLSPMRYFAPPISGLDDLHYKGGEADADELDELLKARRVYGKATEYYSRYGRRQDGSLMPALGFCRSVKAARVTASGFREAGFSFESIDGAMPRGKQKALIEGLRAGKLHGLCCADLLTYGFDAPLIEYGFSLRPTMSRALYFQMVGRGLRPYTDKTTGYEKKGFLFFDHVNMINTHRDSRYPGVPLFYIDGLKWNFTGRDKRKKEKLPPVSSRLCPYIDYQYCNKKTCAGCAELPEGIKKDTPEIFVNIKLAEAPKPVSFYALAPEEKRDVQDKISGAVEAYNELSEAGADISGPVKDLVDTAKKLNRNVMWVYWTLTPEGRHTVNIPLLYAIEKAAGYKRGWVFYKTKELRDRQKEKLKENLGRIIK
jgi:superfamily II DNA or RNA helicase